MTKEQAISQARDLSERWEMVWCVVESGGRFTPRKYDGLLNGHRLGVDYFESQIIWKYEHIVEPV